MGTHIVAGDTDVLIVVDIQNDFCPGGRLPVPGGSDVVPVINRLAGRFANIVVTQDWHPHDHFSFASMHPGKQPGDDHRRPLWSSDALAGPLRAGNVRGSTSRVVMRSASHNDPAQGVSSHDRFIFDVLRERPSDADRSYRVFTERSLTRVFLAGLAFDFCVRYSAEDAQRAGPPVLVIEDACRSIDVGGSAEAAQSAFQNLSIQSIAAGDFA